MQYNNGSSQISALRTSGEIKVDRKKKTKTNQGTRKFTNGGGVPTKVTTTEGGNGCIPITTNQESSLARKNSSGLSQHVPL
jgi:hypothetical protein